MLLLEAMGSQPLSLPPLHPLHLRPQHGTCRPLSRVDGWGCEAGTRPGCGTGGDTVGVSPTPAWTSLWDRRPRLCGQKRSPCAHSSEQPLGPASHASFSPRQGSPGSWPSQTVPEGTRGDAGQEAPAAGPFLVALVAPPSCFPETRGAHGGACQGQSE